MPCREIAKSALLQVWTTILLSPCKFPSFKQLWNAGNWHKISLDGQPFRRRVKYPQLALGASVEYNKTGNYSEFLAAAFLRFLFLSRARDCSKLTSSLHRS